MSTKVKTPLKDISIKNLGDGNELYLIDLEVLSSGIIASIDAQLVKICEGNSGRTVQLVKDRIKKYLDKKRGSDLEIGSIAEFMLHHHLNLLGFPPKFMLLYIFRVDQFLENVLQHSLSHPAYTRL